MSGVIGGVIILCLWYLFSTQLVYLSVTDYGYTAPSTPILIYSHNDRSWHPSVRPSETAEIAVDVAVDGVVVAAVVEDN